MILHSKTENELVYTASDAKDFDLGLIEENLSDKNTDFVKILIPDGVQPDLELLNPLSKKYVVNLLMYGNKNRIQSIGVPAPTQSNVRLSSMFYSDREELLTDVKFTTSNFYNSVWKDVLPATYLRTMDEILLSVVQPENSLKIMNDHKLAALVCLFDINSALLEPFRCIGWIWISNDLPSIEKQAIHFEVSTWLQEQDTNLAASIFVGNGKAIAFNKKLGLAPKWIRLGKF